MPPNITETNQRKLEHVHIIYVYHISYTETTGVPINFFYDTFESLIIYEIPETSHLFDMQTIA